MKSERRHELQHNDLADWFLTTYESMLPYRTVIIFGTLLVVVAAVAWTIWRNHAQSSAATAWNEVEIAPVFIHYPAVQLQYGGQISPIYDILGYAAEMEKDGNTYSGTTAGQWARLLAADSLLAVGQGELLPQKENAAQHFNMAMDRYQKTLDEMSSPIALQRAMFGKARLLESVGKLPEATAAYQDLNKEYPKGIYTAVAEGRLAQLGKPETAEFYQALAKYSPKAKSENPAAKKGAGNAAAGPRGKLDNMTLPDNPEETAPSKSPLKSGETAKPGVSSSGAAKPSAVAAIPATSATPPSAASKSTAVIPPATGAPAASGSGPAKK